MSKGTKKVSNFATTLCVPPTSDIVPPTSDKQHQTWNLKNPLRRKRSKALNVHGAHSDDAIF